MAELVDALDSKSGEHLLVPVQVRPAVPEAASDGKTAPFDFWLGRVLMRYAENFSTKKIARQEAQAEALKPTRRAILLAGVSPCLSLLE